MKKVGLALVSTLALAGSAAVPVALGQDSSAKAAKAVGPTVTVQVKALTKTLLKPTAARGRTGWITMGSTPSGKCSAGSAAGALDAATHGRWAGKYYSGVGIFITSILGVKPSGSDFWGISVNGKFSNAGVCGIKLRSGERLLFQIKK